MLSEVQSKSGVRGRTELHEGTSTMNRNKNPKRGGMRASGEEGRWLNVNP